MARALLHKDWEAAVKVVQLLGAACSSTAPPSAAVGAELQRRWSSIQVAFEEKQLMAMSAATWRQLVESKTPYRLASACRRVMQHCSPAPVSPSAQQQQPATQQPFAATAYSFVLQLLHVLVGKADRDRWLTAGTAPGASSKSWAGLAQQLQQSGVLQLLPSLLSQVTAQMQAATRASPVFSDSLAAFTAGKLTSFAGLDFASATGSPGAAQPPGSSSGSSSSSTGQQHDSGSGSCDSSSSSSTDTIDVLQAATAVLELCRLVALSGMSATEGESDCRLPVLRAVLPVLPFISHCMQHASVQHSYSVQARLVQLWWITEQLALITAHSLVHTSSTAGALEAEYADVLPSMVTVSCSLGYKQLLLQLPALPAIKSSFDKVEADAASGSSSGGGRSSSSPSSSSSSSCLARLRPGDTDPRSPSFWLAQTWQLASQQCSNLPESHVQLAQLLGCNIKVLVWLAASHAVLNACAATYSAGSQCAEALAAAQYPLFVSTLDACAQLVRHAASSARLEQLQPDEQHKLLQLHYLLPSVLLYYAAHQPTDSSLGATQQAEGRHLAVQCSAEAGIALMTMLQQLAHSQPAGSAQRQPLASPAVYQVMLQQLFLLGSHIASELLPQFGCASGGAAGSTAPGATSAAGSSSRSSTAAGSVQLLAAGSLQLSAAGLTTCTAINLLMVLSNSASNTVRLDLTGVERDEQAAKEAATGIGLQHAAWLMQLLEVTVRHRCEENETFTNLGAVCWSLLGYGSVLGCAALAAGPDSPQQAQLISLCCSVLKALSCNRSLAVDDPDLCCLAVMCCAADLFGAASTPVPSGLQHSLGPAGAWLAVLGRCFLHTAAAVQQHLSGAAAASGDLLVLPEVSAALAHLQDWLQQDSVAAQLSAAGLDAAGLLQCALDCPAHQLRTPEGFQAAQQQVQSLAAALTNLPLSQACNNASCSNLSGPRELQLVNGRSCICGGCKQARYCSQACQSRSWLQHRPVCKAIQAAASAAAAAAEAAAASTAAAEAQA